MTDQHDSAPMSDDAGDMQAMSDAGSDVEYMFALTGSRFELNLDGRITLHGVSATTLFFSDRPYRPTGHVPTEDFVAQWGVGTATLQRIHRTRCCRFSKATPSTTLWSYSQSRSCRTAT